MAQHGSMYEIVISVMGCIFNIFINLISDCGDPSEDGYIIDAPSSSNVGDTANVTECASDYTGSPSNSTRTCQASGLWTGLSGCTAIGKDVN